MHRDRQVPHIDAFRELRTDDEIEIDMPPLIHVSKEGDVNISEGKFGVMQRSEMVLNKLPTESKSGQQLSQRDILAFEHHCKYSFMRSHLSRLLDQ